MTGSEWDNERQNTRTMIKSTFGVLAFLPGDGDLGEANFLISSWQPCKFFTGSHESSLWS